MLLINFYLKGIFSRIHFHLLENLIEAPAADAL